MKTKKQKRNQKDKKREVGERYITKNQNTLAQRILERENLVFNVIFLGNKIKTTKPKLKIYTMNGI